MIMSWCAHLGPVGSPRYLWERISTQNKMWQLSALKCSSAEISFSWMLNGTRVLNRDALLHLCCCFHGEGVFVSTSFCCCSDMDREVVYKEIKHLTMLREVKHVVYIYAVYELDNVVHIVMEV